MKKQFTFILALAMLMIMLAGCSGNTSPGTSGVSSTGTSAVTDDSNPLGLDEKITISYSHVQSTSSPTHLAMTPLRSMQWWAEILIWYLPI